MKTFALCLLAAILFSCNSDVVKLDNAYVKLTNKKIVTSTGQASRIWEFDDVGLVTSHLSLTSKGVNTFGHDTHPSWDLPVLEDEKALLSGITAKVAKDEGFTSKHIEVTADFNYPDANVDLRYVIWVYPDAPGFRTQIFLRKKTGEEIKEFTNGSSEILLFPETYSEYQSIGYFNNTQNRNTPGTPILQVEHKPLDENQNIDWANAINVSDGENGVILIKESHKCVNQQGVNSGGFNISGLLLESYGLGLDTRHLTTDYQPCWATWCILYKGSEEDMQAAIKTFDRIRYPIDPKRDIYIMSNTWGSGDDYANSKYASREENILLEIESDADLGLDLLQIDDGWQGWDYSNWRPAETAVYKKRSNQTESMIPDNTEYLNYPEGWVNIKKAADNAGLRMGLWGAWNIPYEDLVWNYDNGGFTSYKLDFANLNNYKKLNDFITKVREFVIYTEHNVRVNWDVTENPPRIGYYYGREYGNIYLENRKPMMPEEVVYHPWLVLRDAWHIAHYTNLNNFQVTYQNIDRVNRDVSDAYLHAHDYCLAITLMASPIFFQETHLLTDEARKQIKPLIKTYKEVRNEMFTGYVYPIGDEPTNSSWSGFQNVVITDRKSGSGYITLFRERLNEETEKKIQLRFTKNTELQLENLLTGEKQIIEVDDNGWASFSIVEAGSFRFYRYSSVR